jgi:hypothetical protein
MRPLLTILLFAIFTDLRPQSNDMRNQDNIPIPKMKFDQNGELIIIPSPTSSNHDFDFYEGKWKLRNRKLKTRLNNSTEWTEFESTQEMYRVLNGLGNIDN